MLDSLVRQFDLRHASTMLSRMTTAGLWLYRALLRLALPIVVPLLWLQDRFTGKRRPAFRERLARRPPPVAPGGLWIHAVSVGEVEVARRLVAELERKDEELPVLLTATTATGLALARRTVGQRHPVLPCPLDLPGPVRRVLGAIRPRVVVLVETELWPELMHQAQRAGIPVVVANGRLSEGSMRRYRLIGGLLEPLLEPLTRVLVRDSADRRRFAELGVAASRIEVVGNIKYDLEPDVTPLDWAETATALAGDRPIVVLGSTMEGEETALLGSLGELSASGQPSFAILAPRHPERFEDVAELLRRRDIPYVRRSERTTGSRQADVILLDTIGELARAYRLADVAFVGGSLVSTGGHNPLEAAVWGVPVLSGRHVDNFEEVYRELVSAGGARLVGSGAELPDALRDWLADPRAARAAGEAGRHVVESNRGATARTAEVLLGVMAGGE